MLFGFTLAIYCFFVALHFKYTKKILELTIEQCIFSLVGFSLVLVKLRVVQFSLI